MNESYEGVDVYIIHKAIFKKMRKSTITVQEQNLLPFGFQKFYYVNTF